jgi:murein DD-endopeptidase MepM/ murein hydrolase activator NlpD
MNPRLRQLSRGFFVLGVEVLILTVFLPIGIIVGLGAYHDLDETAYEILIARMLGGSGTSGEINFSEVTQSELLSEGLDPLQAAYSVEASEWISSTYGGSVDVGMLLATNDLESDSGRNMGSYDGLESAKANPRLNSSDEEVAVIALLAHWKEYSVRNHTNPSRASDFIYPAYTGYLGHRSAGEIASGFIPTTAWKICLQMMSSEDPLIASCDFWHPKVDSFARAYWLYAIGYNSLLPENERTAKLYGWNRSQSWREQLVLRSNEINALAIEYNSVNQADFDYLKENQSYRSALINVLNLLGLMPEISGRVLAASAEKSVGSCGVQTFVGPGGTGTFVLPTGSSYVSGWIFRDPGKPSHGGLDYGCTLGKPIVSADNGIVSFAGWSSVGYGNLVVINHGNGYETYYAHLSDLAVICGDSVEQGQVIGNCGSTGNSTGPHLHYEIRKNGICQNPKIYEP